MMKGKRNLLIAIALLFLMAFAPAVYAFSDLAGSPDEAKINDLEKAGIVSGVSEDHFAPQAALTFAQGVQLIVKGFDLNIDNIRFIKEPKASDYFTHVPDDAWYSPAFIIAQLNGVALDKDVDPNAHMTREVYAHLLFGAMEAKTDIVLTQEFMMFDDSDQVKQEYMSSIQALLKLKIAELDKDKKFRPNADLNRGEAAVMLHDAIEFVKTHPKQVETPPKQEDVSMKVEQAAEGVNKVTLSWGEKPNPGYRLTIDSIQFGENGEAQIHYTLHYPKIGVFYIQQVTEAKASIYLDASLKPIPVQHIQEPLPMNTAPTR